MDETKLSFTQRAVCFNTNLLFCTDAQGIFNKNCSVVLFSNHFYIEKCPNILKIFNFFDYMFLKVYDPD